MFSLHPYLFFSQPNKNIFSGMLYGVTLMVVKIKEETMLLIQVQDKFLFEPH